MKSHVDLLLGLRFLVFDDLDLNEEERAELKDDRTPDARWVAMLGLLRRKPRTFFHETYHYWQVLRLPYLLWLTADSVKSIVGRFRALARTTSDYRQWKALDLADTHISQRFLIHRYGARPVLMDGEREQGGKLEEPFILSSIDLLENAASLAEWKAIQPGVTSAYDSRAYRLWSKRTAAYSNVFKYVDGRLNGNFAIRSFLSLVRAAFHTTVPPLAFARLLTLLEQMVQNANTRSIMDAKEPSNWDGLFARLLDSETFDQKNNYGIGPGKGYYRLELKAYAGLKMTADGREEYCHPFSGSHSEEWIALEEKDARYADVFTQFPHTADYVFKDCLSRFQPTINIARVPDESSRMIVLPFHLGSTKSTSIWGIPMLEWMAVYSAVRRAAASDGELGFRLCDHRQCPEFDSNFCNAWPSVPADFRKCGFPRRIKDLIEIFAQFRGAQ